jgi:hypothetical protein
MELKMPEEMLIDKLRSMLARENDPDVVAEFMQTIAALERQRRKNILRENSSMSLERDCS